MVAIDFKETGNTVREFWSSLSLEPKPYFDGDGRVAALYGGGHKASGLPVT